MRLFARNEYVKGKFPSVLQYTHSTSSIKGNLQSLITNRGFRSSYGYLKLKINCHEAHGSRCFPIRAVDLSICCRFIFDRTNLFDVRTQCLCLCRWQDSTQMTATEGFRLLMSSGHFLYLRQRSKSSTDNNNPGLI